MSKAPTKKQRERWQLLREHGCVICYLYPSIHHAETGMGGRKNHDKVMPLCHNHHQGAQGIHTLGRRKWGEIYGTEEHWLEYLLTQYPI